MTTRLRREVAEAGPGVVQREYSVALTVEP